MLVGAQNQASNAIAAMRPAGLSAILLLAAILTDMPFLVGLVLLSIGASAAFGLKYSIYGAIWRRLAKALSLPKVEPEHEYPPRFAQVLGSVALILALGAFALGAASVGWGFALAVAGLQTLLANDRYCLGCRLYFLRWWVPDLVTRIWTGGRSGGPNRALAPQPITYRSGPPGWAPWGRAASCPTPRRAERTGP